MTVVLAHAPVDSAEAAFGAAVRQASLQGWDLVIANAASHDAPADTRAVGGSTLQSLVERARQEGVQARAVHLADSDAAAALLNLTEKADAELLVIGVRHRSAIGKLLVGSTAQRLILEAKCPVLSVKA
ncbi:universal stress protein [Nocardiopsis changdeensis]|uniref:Universal stress protein n=1 Tax=Nocardiopsis changdeensis TaxID=2831969 RepID=A0ABX8BE65_9ACTN|nr:MULTISPECIES: universal stress protein [Nocardiopsis]QUX20535.1 universal stress protein [Nocardiopsis changdeensis]QYX36466.1 universal stress protein [Nocardiopsis sp. MT53]